MTTTKIRRTAKTLPTVQLLPVITDWVDLGAPVLVRIHIKPDGAYAVWSQERRRTVGGSQEVDRIEWERHMTTASLPMRLMTLSYQAMERILKRKAREDGPR